MIKTFWIFILPHSWVIMLLHASFTSFTSQYARVHIAVSSVQRSLPVFFPLPCVTNVVYKTSQFSFTLNDIGGCDLEVFAKAKPLFQLHSQVFNVPALRSFSSAGYNLRIFEESQQHMRKVCRPWSQWFSSPLADPCAANCRTWHSTEIDPHATPKCHMSSLLRGTMCRPRETPTCHLGRYLSPATGSLERSYVS